MPHSQTPFVGRASELGDLLAAVSASPSLSLVEGEAGVGKSRLVEELATRVAAGGRRVVTARCRRIREPFPLGPVVDALRRLGDDLAGRELTPVCGVLRPLLPELAVLLPVDPEPPDDRDALRHQVFRAAVEVLATVTPLVLIIEDTHWADEQTVEFLDYMVAEIPDDLRVVLTYRGEEVDPAVLAVAARPPHHITRAMVTLKPFDDVETGAFAAAILGIEQVSDDFAAHLCARSSGLPLAIQELMAVLRERELVTRQGDGEWVRRRIDELDLPAGVREPVRERVARLDQHARVVLEAAAVLREPAPVEVLEAVAGVVAPRRVDALDRALRSALLTEGPAGLGFRHVLASQVVYEGLTVARRRELHRRAAAVLRESEPVPLGQVAHHLWEAGQIAQWAEAAEAAAAQARTHGDDAEAARLLDQVLRKAALAPEHRGRIALGLAQTAMFSRRAPDMVGVLLRQLDAVAEREINGELKLRVARILNNLGTNIALGAQLAEEAVNDLDGDAVLQIEAIAAAGTMAGGRSRSDTGALLRRAVSRLPSIRDPEELTRVSAVVGAKLLWIGDPAWKQLRLPYPRATSPSSRVQSTAAFNFAVAASISGHFEMAWHLYRTMYESADRSHWPAPLEIVFRSVGVALRWFAGDWRGLDEEFDRLFDDLGTTAMRHESEQAFRACLALSRGQTDVAWERLAALLPGAEAANDMRALALACGGLCRIAVARGGAGTVPGVAEFVDIVISDRLVPCMLVGLPPVVQYLAAAGDQAGARRVLAAAVAQAGQLDAPLAPSAIAHSRGQLAMSRQAWPEAVDLLERAAHCYDAIATPYQAAQAREAATHARIRMGDDRAGDVLMQALETYDQLGARWDLNRGLGFARQHGLPVPAQYRRGSRGYGRELSPRELEVARLAASGRTNRQIAAELFLSTNTVNKHLRAVLHKLDITSRRQLASRLGHGERVGADRNG